MHGVWLTLYSLATSPCSLCAIVNRKSDHSSGAATPSCDVHARALLVATSAPLGAFQLIMAVVYTACTVAAGGTFNVTRDGIPVHIRRYLTQGYLLH